MLNLIATNSGRIQGYSHRPASCRLFCDALGASFKHCSRHISQQRSGVLLLADDGHLGIRKVLTRLLGFAPGMKQLLWWPERAPREYDCELRWVGASVVGSGFGDTRIAGCVELYGRCALPCIVLLLNMHPGHHRPVHRSRVIAWYLVVERNRKMFAHALQIFCVFLVVVAILGRSPGWRLRRSSKISTAWSGRVGNILSGHLLGSTTDVKRGVCSLSLSDAHPVTKHDALRLLLSNPPTLVWGGEPALALSFVLL